MLILTGVFILKKWVQENGLDPAVLLLTISTGYYNDELAFKWIEHFGRHSYKTQIEV